MTKREMHLKMPGVRARFLSFAVAAGVASAVLSGPAYAATGTVYKSPWCGCCASWADRLEAEGYTLTIKNVEDLGMIKKLAGIPEELQACHTASIEGYIIEGHVPAKEIERLLTERPEAKGLAVPGMPSGSPGMEGGAPEPYDVVLFSADGTTTVYAQY